MNPKIHAENSLERAEINIASQKGWNPCQKLAEYCIARATELSP
jgi:hypothetical protein